MTHDIIALGDTMIKSIECATTHTILIQKSKFICRLIPIQNMEEVKDYLLKIKCEFPNATHYCYAYICDTIKRCSDDGEPSGTAGMPILNVLEKQQLNHILAIVIRYFGGIKLGTGGLVRAYSNAVIETVSHTKMIHLIPGKLISCTFPYSAEKQIEYLLQNSIIIHKNYQEKITYIVKITDEKYQDLETSLSKITIITILDHVLVQKEIF